MASGLQFRMAVVGHGESLLRRRARIPGPPSWSTTMPTGRAGAASRCFRREHFAEVADRGRPARPADRRACDRRRRRARRARRLRGGAEGQRQARQPPPHRAHRGDDRSRTCRALPRSACIASMQPPHPPGAMDFPLEPTISRIGRKRWPLCYAWRTLKNAGAHIVFASDWPVSPHRPDRGHAGGDAAQTLGRRHARPELHARGGDGRLHGRGRLCRVHASTARAG